MFEISSLHLCFFDALLISFSLLSSYVMGKKALGTSVEAAIEKYSAEGYDLKSPAISKMELFGTLYDCHKKLHLRCCRGPCSIKGYNSYFFIDRCINFPCLQKSLPLFFLLFLENGGFCDFFFLKS